ncbi:hypothetical protein [Aliterella atlantica]|uniref:YtkA-like domain-containing protein n=1 Tax=Aliterella atlantica CENA595 TaxID=1618023 RepID=A0A0D8ZRC5_9CYAN|nr:hypothetical protein [Aliterella atlantica]KJH71270.1 hypothetical protein UH38_13360 [Aliterella atlantica CENA595]
MKLVKTSLILFASLGLLGLAACNNEQTTDVKVSPSAQVETSPTTSNDQASVPQAGGQVVESGEYHLELVPEPEANGTHLDFYLQTGDNHQPIADAKVTAQVQSPDGKQQTLNLTYDVSGKHYAALLPEKAAGQYQVKITSDIKGEKVDGRFSFNL